MRLHFFMKFSLFPLIALSLLSCTKPTSEKPANKKTLNVYSWSNYFTADLIKTFEDQTGAKVVFTYFSSNEELFAKLSAGATGYDVIVPSGYVLKALRETKLIEPLGKLDWPELKDLNKEVLGSNYDSSLEYSVPYQIGLTGVAINKAKIKGNVDSLAWLFDHAELKGKIALLDDAPTVVGFALKYLGYSFNESSDEAFAKVKTLLLKTKKNIKVFSSEPIPLLESGEIAIAQAYSGDVLQLKRKLPNIEFVHAKEGGEIFIDHLAIPKGAQNPELAKEFIRMTLNKKLAALQTLHLLYTPVVDLNGVPSLNTLLKNNVIFPNAEILKKYQLLEDSPDRHEKIERLWTEVKSS